MEKQSEEQVLQGLVEQSGREGVGRISTVITELATQEVTELD